MKKTSTQDFLEIDQIREGVIILKNKGLRSIMMVSSLNFALKSNEEQEAIIAQFQNFLNSLNFFCQILIQSRRLNITGYLEQLRDLEQKQENELLQVQTTGYREFIEEGTIMSKTFYVVVPYSMSETQEFGAIKKPWKKIELPKLTEENFQRTKKQLRQRIEFVALGLRRCGLQSVPLTTAEIIELFWSIHHPKQAETGYYPELPPELTQ
jgi:2-iminoacetate synthase ThiH